MICQSFVAIGILNTCFNILGHTSTVSFLSTSFSLETPGQLCYTFKLTFLHADSIFFSFVLCSTVISLFSAYVAVFMLYIAVSCLCFFVVHLPFNFDVLFIFPLRHSFHYIIYYNFFWCYLMFLNLFYCLLKSHLQVTLSLHHISIFLFSVPLFTTMIVLLFEQTLSVCLPC